MSRRAEAEQIAADAGIPPDPEVEDEPVEWEELVPLGSRRTLPTFPVDAFPGWVKDMVLGVAEETQVPADIPAGLALGALATAAGGKAEVRVRGVWSEPTNLFLAVVAEPGTRKSANFRAITTPLYEAEKALNAESKDKRREAEIRRSQLEKEDREARAKAKDGKAENLVEAVEAAAALEKAEAEMPAELQLIAKNVTPEECSTLLAEQGGRLAIQSAEGDIFDIISGRYSNGAPALSPFLEGHAGDVLKVNRRGRAEYIENPALTIAVCIQPAVLTFIAEKPRLRGQGLLARFLYAVPPDKVGHRAAEPELIAEDVRTSYNTKMKALVLSLAGWDSPFTLTLDEPARKLVTEFMAELEPRLQRGTPLEPLRDWASKLTGAIVRIAGLLHLAEHLDNGYRRPVDEATVRNAIEIGRYYEAHAIGAFGTMREDPGLGIARRALEWLTRRPEDKREVVTQRDMHRALQSHLDKAASVRPVLALLAAHGYLREQPAPPKSSKGGRAASPRYDINPQIYETADTTDTTR
ncbi:YfjI family protein [Spirillospora sp. NPDC048911]|uniref:YfjI family protein n=1 Tax=Spirillospora sp. NPDC048911 TaxID=3364527 RepID=UPI003724AA22